MDTLFEYNEIDIICEEFELDMLKCEEYEDYLYRMMDTGFYESVDAFYEASASTQKSVIDKIIANVKAAIAKVIKFFSGEKIKDDVKKLEELKKANSKVKTKIDIKECDKVAKDLNEDFKRLSKKKDLTEEDVDKVSSKLDKFKTLIKTKAVPTVVGAGVVLGSIVLCNKLIKTSDSSSGAICKELEKMSRDEIIQATGAGNMIDTTVFTRDNSPRGAQLRRVAHKGVQLIDAEEKSGVQTKITNKKLERVDGKLRSIIHVKRLATLGAEHATTLARYGAELSKSSSAVDNALSTMANTLDTANRNMRMIDAEEQGPKEKLPQYDKAYKRAITPYPKSAKKK